MSKIEKIKTLEDRFHRLERLEDFFYGRMLGNKTMGRYREFEFSFLGLFLGVFYGLSVGVIIPIFAKMDISLWISFIYFLISVLIFYGIDLFNLTFRDQQNTRDKEKGRKKLIDDLKNCIVEKSKFDPIIENRRLNKDELLKVLEFIKAEFTEDEFKMLAKRVKDSERNVDLSSKEIFEPIYLYRVLRYLHLTWKSELNRLMREEKDLIRCVKNDKLIKEIYKNENDLC